MDKESAFADLIKDHENRWVAITEKDGVESIVGTGNTAAEAVNEATVKGYSQAVLFKVPSFKGQTYLLEAAGKLTIHETTRTSTKNTSLFELFRVFSWIAFAFRPSSAAC